MGDSPDFLAGREAAAKDLETEAREYELQYGKTGRGGLVAGALMMAARIARVGLTEYYSESDQQ